VSAQESSSETVGFRLSPQQEWLLRDEGGVVQCAATITGPVDGDGLQGAWADVMARYEILRTTFPRPAGMRNRTQIVHDAMLPGWRQESSAGDSSAGLEDVLAREAAAGFDLDQGPLIRGLMLKSDAQTATLVLSAHPACVDAFSLREILHELITGEPAGESAEPIQYADYAEWRHELTSGDEPEAADGRRFWSAQAASWASAPRLLFGPSGGEPGGWRSVPIAFSSAEAAAIQAAGHDAGLDGTTFLEACWHALLARLTGAGDLLLAGWCDGRAQPDLDGAIGAYAQPVPVHSHLEADTTLSEVLDQVRRSRAEGARRQDYAGAEDLERLCADASAGFAPPSIADLGPSGSELQTVSVPAQSPLLLAVGLRNESLQVELWYDPAIHGAEDAADLARRMHTLALSGVSHPATPVARLALTDSEERQRLQAQAVGPAPGADADIPVHRGFERQAALTPDRTAVAGQGAELSYAKLNAAANRLAHLLRDSGVGRNVTVGLCLHRTPRLLEAVLAILKAGGAYVPLNYEHPPARIAHQLAEAGAKVLISEQGLLDRLPDFDGDLVCVDRDAERIAVFPEEDPEPVTEPGDLVYVMYTSGSTGLPKGVAVTHGNLANYAACLAERLEPGDDGAMRFGVVSAISTDLGNTCIFPPLISGGCVQLITPEAAMDADALVAECGGARLDVLKITPSHLGALLVGEHAVDALPRRWLVLGGEALSWELVARLRGLETGCRILNHYGPTETTIGCCAHEVGDARQDAATVPIGRPLAGVRAYVLDAGLELAPPGVPGELCIAGAGVAAGYIGGRGQEDGGEGPFQPDPFAGQALGERMYRTGDRARYLRDGAIEFLGRVDDQVKIRGFRVEPGEIETVLARHPDVRQAAVVPELDERGELRLVGYLATSADPSVEDLQAFLAESLPEYMVPSAFATLESMPFTPSGKIDRRALAELASVETRREAEYVAPRDEVEEQIASIWAQLLGVERVGVFDDFFALGGHSLLATQAIMRIRREHGNIPLRALLAAPTVAALAEVVRSASAPQ
jgi:amino acid adenylation domain-containing protein